ncbi:MAG: hypothetical protein EOO88_35500 [Pedobacter sp.]|nr:MAG: hypothetical protein EOO88_35500 [Pedobacter sp.]
MEFKETQQLKLWWLYILIGLEALIIFLVMFVGKQHITFDELHAMNYVPVLAIVAPFLLVYAINTISFNYEINERGVSYRYFSITGKHEFIPWHSIKNIYFRKYDALGEYGGWGVKYRLWFKLRDKAYVFNDNNKGLQIELKNGKKILFSTNKLDELELFLFNFNSRYKIPAIDNHG